MPLDTKLKGWGPNEDKSVQVDPSFYAARVSAQPLEYAPVNGTLGGHYAVGTMTGLMAAGIASAAEVFQVRWADTAKMFVLERLIVQFSTATGFAATTVGAPVELIVGHGSTANGSGGAAVSPSSNSNRLRSTMAPTAFVSSGGIRIATTAALTAATNQTLEAAPIASCMGADNRTLVSTPPFPLFDATDGGSHPLVLSQGDTLVIRTLSPAATGTWYMSVAMRWLELSSF